MVGPTVQPRRFKKHLLAILFTSYSFCQGLLSSIFLISITAGEDVLIEILAIVYWKYIWKKSSETKEQQLGSRGAVNANCSTYTKKMKTVSTAANFKTWFFFIFFEANAFDYLQSRENRNIKPKFLRGLPLSRFLAKNLRVTKITTKSVLKIIDSQLILNYRPTLNYRYKNYTPQHKWCEQLGCNPD